MFSYMLETVQDTHEILLRSDKTWLFCVRLLTGDETKHAD